MRLRQRFVRAQLLDLQAAVRRQHAAGAGCRQRIGALRVGDDHGVAQVLQQAGEPAYARSVAECRRHGLGHRHQAGQHAAPEARHEILGALEQQYHWLPWVQTCGP